MCGHWRLGGGRGGGSFYECDFVDLAVILIGIVIIVHAAVCDIDIGYIRIQASRAAAQSGHVDRMQEADVN